MVRPILSTLVVLLVIYVVPFLVYGLASVMTGLQPPTAASPTDFLLGVLLTKIGTAAAFVAFFAASRGFWESRWKSYAAIWFVVFLFGEAGDAVSGRSTGFMAVLGVVSEAIYVPLAAYLTLKVLRTASAQSGRAA